MCTLCVVYTITFERNLGLSSYFPGLWGIMRYKSSSKVDKINRIVPKIWLFKFTPLAENNWFFADISVTIENLVSWRSSAKHIASCHSYRIRSKKIFFGYLWNKMQCGKVKRGKAGFFLSVSSFFVYFLFYTTQSILSSNRISTHFDAKKTYADLCVQIVRFWSSSSSKISLSKCSYQNPMSFAIDFEKNFNINQAFPYT